MNISKRAIESCIAEMPDIIDTDEVMHRLYLLQKIEAGEADIRDGKILVALSIGDLQKCAPVK